MKTFIKLFLMALTTLLFIACSGEKKEETNPTTAVKSNKIEIIFLEQHNCGSCELLKETMQRKEVKKIVDANFIVKYMDISKANRLPKGLMEPFGTPTLYFLSPQGQEIHDPIMGAKNKDELIDTLNEVVANYKALKPKS